MMRRRSADYSTYLEEPPLATAACRGCAARWVPRQGLQARRGPGWTSITPRVTRTSVGSNSKNCARCAEGATSWRTTGWAAPMSIVPALIALVLVLWLFALRMHLVGVS